MANLLSRCSILVRHDYDFQSDKIIRILKGVSCINARLTLHKLMKVPVAVEFDFIAGNDVYNVWSLIR